MNNEIKEILDKIQNVVNHKEASYNALIETKAEDYKQLLDYIINLQQDYDNEQEENLKLSEWLVEKQQRIEGLEAENETLRSDFKNQVEYTNKIAEENERLKEANKILEENWKHYMMICGKAIKYINCNKQKTIGAYGDNEDDDFEICLWEEDIDNLLNILQNGSDTSVKD